MNIGKDYADGRLTLYLEGELDHHSARPAMKAIEQAMEETLPRLCVLDMAGLSFMDSSGIGVVMGRYNKTHEGGGTVYVTGCDPYVDRILELSGIYLITRRRNTVGEALAECRGRTEERR